MLYPVGEQSRESHADGHAQATGHDERPPVESPQHVGVDTGHEHSDGSDEDGCQIRVYSASNFLKFQKQDT